MEGMTEIQQLQRQIERLQLGFIDIRYRVVYCNRRCEGALWYTVEDGQQIPIKQNALRGYADRLEVVNLQRRGKETDKLQFTLNCGDIHFVLEAGADSEFAQSLVYALAVLSPQQLKQPIIIQPEPGEDNAVLFARVRTHDYRRVFVERNKFARYEQALEQAIAHVHTASGNRPRSESSEPVAHTAASAPTAAPSPVPDRPALNRPIETTPIETTPIEMTPPEPVSLEPASLDSSPMDGPPLDAATRFQTIATWTGHKPSQLRAIAKRAALPASSADMTPEQQVTMRNAILLDWAAKYPVWKQDDDCWNAYQSTLKQLPTDATDAKIWETWKAAIAHRLAGLQHQAKKPLATAS